MTAETEIEMEVLNQNSDTDIIENYDSDEGSPTIIPESWSSEKRKLYEFFNEVDTNDDGYVDLEELRARIFSNDCHNIPYNYQRIILENDHIQDLDFNSFYEVFRRKPWSLRKSIDSYCKWLLPPQPKLSQNKQRKQDNGVSILMGQDMADGLYEDEMKKVCPPPVFIFLFSVIELSVFLSEVWYHYDKDPSSIDSFGESLSGPLDILLLYNPKKRYEAWRFLTYMFVHKGLSHILGNIFMQLLLGLPLEVVHKWRIVVVYLCGVIAGSMGTSLATPNIYLVGASAGVYALLTAHLATIFLVSRKSSASE
ncbi:RHBDL2.2 family protein [Megaselia abdita]